MAYVELAQAGLNNYEIAERLEVDEASVRRGLKRAGYTRDRVPTNTTQHIHLDPPLEHVGGAVIAADFHLPLFDPVLTNRVIDVAEESGIKTLVAAGDVFNMDSLSRFEPKQESDDLWFEITTGVAVFRVLLETFDKIYLIKGNHDFRLAKALGFKLKFNNCMRMMFGDLGNEALDKIHFSCLDHMWVRPYPGAPAWESWYVCHPESYSRVPLANPSKLSAIHNANIITAHSHHFAQGWAVDGKRVIAEAGGLFDISKTAYLQATTTHPTWQNGFFWLDYNKGGDNLGINSLPELWLPRT